MKERKLVLVTHAPEYFDTPECYEKQDVKVFCKNLLDRSESFRKNYPNVEFVAVSVEDGYIHLRGFRTETDEEFRRRIDAEMSAEMSAEQRLKDSELRTLHNLLTKYGLPEGYTP